MTTLEIILLIAGAVVLILGYAVPVRGKGEENDTPHTEEQIHEIISREVEASRGRLEGIVDETVDYAMDKTERSLERVTNEKMMALSDYSNTIMDDINKNHKEVLFMYDMLHDKHENLKSTVSEASKAEKKVKEATREAKEVQRENSDTEEAGTETDKAAYAKSEPDDIQADSGISETEGETIGFVPFVPEHVRIENEEDKDKIEETDSSEPVIFKPVNEENVLLPKKNDQKTQRSAAGRKKADTALKTKDDKEPVLQFAQGMQSRNNNEKILKLHKSGRSNTAIARELGLGIGEVKLVIDLYESK